MRYRMILFDFFNTLAVTDSSAIPRLEVDGREVTSTAALLHERLAAERPGLEVREVHRAMAQASSAAREKWGAALREPPALERFEHVVAALGLEPGGGELARELLARHMGVVAGSIRFPQSHLELLERLRAGRRLGIFSNFDHAPTLHGLLQRHGVAGWFDPVVISEAIGYRKPGQAAFDRALALTGEARERILFVGDSLQHDVEGALAAGLDVAWVNPNGAQASPEAQPTYTLTALTGLEALLDDPSGAG